MTKTIDKEVMADLMSRNYKPKVTEIFLTDDVAIHINDLVHPDLIQSIAEPVVDGCFTEDGRYNPTNLEFMRRMAILLAYTDIEFVEDLYEQYAFVYRTNVFELVTPYINANQLNDVYTAIDDMIAYRKRATVANIESDVAKMYGEISAITSQMKSVYGDMSGEDMKGIIAALSNGRLDEKKLVEAITETKPAEKPVAKTAAKTTRKTATKK